MGVRLFRGCRHDGGRGPRDTLGVLGAALHQSEERGQNSGRSFCGGRTRRARPNQKDEPMKLGIR